MENVLWKCLLGEGFLCREQLDRVFSFYKFQGVDEGGHYLFIHLLTHSPLLISLDGVLLEGIVEVGEFLDESI